jgi:membrane-anchored glycerophosphoryl diester phosphodiesterase (GDPDase)
MINIIAIGITIIERQIVQSAIKFSVNMTKISRSVVFLCVSLASEKETRIALSLGLGMGEVGMSYCNRK